MNAFVSVTKILLVMLYKLSKTLLCGLI